MFGGEFGDLGLDVGGEIDEPILLPIVADEAVDPVVQCDGDLPHCSPDRRSNPGYRHQDYGAYVTLRDSRLFLKQTLQPVGDPRDPVGHVCQPRFEFLHPRFGGGEF